jgi:PAS domain S-box-containing protein
MRKNNRCITERSRASVALVKTLRILVLTIAVLCPPGVYAQQQAPAELTCPNAHIPEDHSLWCIMCAAPSGIGTIKNGAIAMVNDYITRLLGYSTHELLGRSTRMLYPDEHEYTLAAERQAQLDAMHETCSFETRWQAKDGRIFDVQLCSTLMDSGSPDRDIVFTVRNITEHKQADLLRLQRARDFHAGSVIFAAVLAVLFFQIRRNFKRLKESEHELTVFREAVESSTDAIGMSTPQGRHYYQNRAFNELFGDIGATPATTLYVDPAVGAHVFSAILSGGQWAGEVKMYDRDRSKRDIFLRAYANKNKNGTIISLVGIHTDITENKKTAAALRESEQKIGTILNAIDDVIMSYSLSQDHLLYLSPSLATVFGRSMETFEQNWCLWMDYVHPDDRQKISDHAECLGDKNYADDEFRIIRPDGTVAWVRSRTKIVYTDDGEPDRLDRIISDITDRKQAELALQESEQKLATLFASMAEMVVMHDLVFEEGRPVNYRISDCNRAFTEITGIPRDAAVGRLATDVYNTTPPPYLEEFSRVALTGEPYCFETYFTSMNKHFAVSVVCPGPNRFATITADITTRRQSEQEQDRLQAQLTQAQKIESIGRLAGGVAHDFNNILSVILGYTDMALQHVGTDQTLRDDLLEIRQAVERSTKLTRQLLAFARKQTIAPRVLDLNATVEDMLKMLRRLIGEDIDLAWLPGKGLRPVTIDPSQLDQVLANLCVNARDAIADVGRITIETANVTLDEAHCARYPDCVPGAYVMLAVSDDGCGMDQETLVNIFDPFFTTKDIGTGTGLGLSTVYGIVKQNNGCIKVSSEPGSGTRFCIYLPQHHLEDTGGQELDGMDRPVARGTETVVLVEDEPANLEMYCRMLDRLGYTVLPAGAPEKCLHLVSEHDGRIDLLLTDVVMPGMNGPDLWQKLRTDMPELKCLFMSGYTDKAFGHKGVIEPGVHFIQKPFSLEELADKIRGVLDGYSDS